LPKQIEYFQETFKKERGTGSYLGQGCKGIYVCAVGGLPLFSSGSRIIESCDLRNLVFDEPCDEDHVYVRTEIESSGTSSLNVYCVRSQICVGKCRSDKNKNISKLYIIDSSKVLFLPADIPWPPECQPENFWGTEGQYCAWNNHARIRDPLSY